MIIYWEDMITKFHFQILRSFKQQRMMQMPTGGYIFITIIFPTIFHPQMSQHIIINFKLIFQIISMASYTVLTISVPIPPSSLTHNSHTAYIFIGKTYELLLHQLMCSMICHYSHVSYLVTGPPWYQWFVYQHSLWYIQLVLKF